MARSLIAISFVLMLGIACFMRNDIFEDEITSWSDVLAKSPNKARVNYNLGQAYLVAGGRQKQALPLFQRALELDPDYLDAQSNLAMTLYGLGMKTEAAQEFSRIIERYPFKREAAFARAMLSTIQAEGH